MKEIRYQPQTTGKAETSDGPKEPPKVPERIPSSRDEARARGETAALGDG